MTKKHTPPPKELEYKTALHDEHHMLEEVDIPIITLSSTHRKGLSQSFYESFPAGEEIVFSRAHYSMAVAILVAGFETGHTAWMTDPMNYVVRDDWNKVIFTQTVGRLMARHKPLKMLKDLIDTKARNKLPVTEPITPPLKYLAKNIRKPIISLHYETGRILAEAGHKVVQVVTDPHVRPQYLDLLSNKENKKVIYCVFDEETKTDLLHQADENNKKLSPSQVIVTGPPVDPRIVAARKSKKASNTSDRPLRLAITTGGVGSNKPEIESILDQLSQFCFKGKNGCAQLFLYAGTHQDFRALYQGFIERSGLKLDKLEDENAAVRILYTDNLVDANEKLIDHMFPWADGIITKPSGDMAYDAAAAGCFTLFLEPLGPWEENIQERFLDLGIGTDLQVTNIRQELEKFGKSYWQGESWFKSATDKVLTLPKLYLEGSKNIVRTCLQYRSLSSSSPMIQ